MTESEKDHLNKRLLGNHDLLGIVGIMLTFISILLILFLVTVKADYTLSNRFFAVFLFIIAIDISDLFSGWFFTIPPNVKLFTFTLAYLQLPALYLYVLSVCYTGFRLQVKHLLHIVPIVIVNLVMMPRFYLTSAVDQALQNEGFLHSFESKFNHAFIHIQIAVYFVLIYYALRQYKKVYVENYSDTKTVAYKWLVNLVSAFAILYAVVLFKNVFKFSLYQEAFEYAKVAVVLFDLGIISWYTLSALNHPELFRRISPELKPLKTTKPIKKTTEVNSAIAINPEIVEKIQGYMETKEPYLNPALTTQMLADQLDIQVKELSSIINHYLNQHFFDFVNEYRIKKSMELFGNPSYKKVTVLEILYEVGFNSKSSFNTAFKKHTSLTPTEYRKNNLSTAPR